MLKEQCFVVRADGEEIARETQAAAALKVAYDELQTRQDVMDEETTIDQFQLLSELEELLRNETVVLSVADGSRILINAFTR